MLLTKTLSLPVTLPEGFQECSRCIGRLKDSLLQVDGVFSVAVEADNGSMTLVYDPALLQLEEIEKRARMIGVDLREHYLHKTFTLKGLDCPDCALKIEKGVGRLKGIHWVSTNFAASRMTVEYEPSEVDASLIAGAVRRLGYDVSVPGVLREEFPAITGRWIADRKTALTTIAGISILLGLLLGELNAVIASKALYGLAVAAGGLYAFRGAFFSIKSLVLDMNFLMSVASVGAVAIGEWFEAAAVMFLFSLGNALEARTMERVRESVRSLLSLFPAWAHVLKDDRETDIPIQDVIVGDIMTVRPGEKIPTDGVVLAGTSTIDQSSVTGESVPVETSLGDTVFAGTLNQRGSIEVKATATVKDNTLAKIIHLVEEAQAGKSPTQRFAEIFGSYYTPSVIGLALLIAVIAPFVSEMTFRSSLYLALTLVVVSCPCALVISTPVSIVSAIGNSARMGVLIKGGAYLEAVGRVEVVAFDKTGTVTTGKSMVTDVLPVNGFKREDVLSLAASVETRSEHPLAEAILHEAAKEGLSLRKLTDFEALTGMGAAAKFDGDTCVVGNSRLMEQLGVELIEQQALLDDLQSHGKTVVMVTLNNRLAGMVALGDTVRQTARNAFEELRHMGISRIIMLTGDNEQAARVVAKDLHIDEYYAELLPQDKVDVVRLLVERYGRRVAFVGDGVNDAPALAVATVGIAMGAAGSDTALETADIALMSDDLSKLAYLIRLSRAARRTVKQNLVFSLGVIAVLILTTLVGWLKLSLGVFGHEGSALVVIANGMRLLRFR